jgi:polyhydroxybutyrate depolymerase
MHRFLFWIATLFAFACGSDDSSATTDSGLAADASADARADGAPMDAAADTAAPRPPSTLGPSDRPARLFSPPAHDGVTPLPIVFLLHGYGANAVLQDAYFGMTAAARALGFYLVLPDGTVDSGGRQFWNATPACCDFGATNVDDVAYLSALLDEAESLVPVDSTRVYFVGHSNGGFMSYRMACEIADRVTAIASLAGSDYATESACTPSESVSVLQIHGTLDATIPYDGFVGGYPSAPDVVERWAGRSGCDTLSPSTGDPIDLETAIVGPETTVVRYDADCEAGLDAELWTIEGGGHIPVIESRTFGTVVADWLLTHE